MIIRFDEEMFAESPVAPGTAGRNTDLCIGALFNPFNGCSADGTAASLSTLHHGTPPPATNYSMESHPLMLAANGATSQIDGFSNTAGIPEPGAWALADSGLLLLLLRWGMRPPHPACVRMQRNPSLSESK